MGGKNDMYLNPAGVGIEGTLQVLVADQDFGYEHKIRSLDFSYRFKKSGIGISIRSIRFGDGILLYGDSSPGRHHSTRLATNELYFKGSFSYTLVRNLELGVGLNIWNSKNAANAREFWELRSVTSLNIDAGLFYVNTSIKNDVIIVSPKIGISLLSFGKGVRYIWNDQTSPLPTTIRIGLGGDTESIRKLYTHPIIRISVAGSISKLLSRIESSRQDGGYSFQAMKPFKQLFNGWGSYSFFNGQEVEDISLREQLWYHFGIEIELLETIKLRYGWQDVGKADYNSSFISYGLGVDFYYLAFDYVTVNNTYGQFLNFRYEDDNYWRIISRFPIDGKKPDVLISKLF